MRPFDSISLKIERADPHLAHLGPLISELEPGAEPPTQSGVIVGDFLHNLRSALDSLAWNLSTRQSTSTYFPIYLAKPKDFHETMGEFISDAQNAIEALQPYNDTDPLGNPLWLLHDMSIADKHRGVLATRSIAPNLTNKSTGEPSTNLASIYFVWQSWGRQVAPVKTSALQKDPRMRDGRLRVSVSSEAAKGRAPVDERYVVVSQLEHMLAVVRKDVVPRFTNM